MAQRRRQMADFDVGNERRLALNGVQKVALVRSSLVVAGDIGRSQLVSRSEQLYALRGYVQNSRGSIEDDVVWTLGIFAIRRPETLLEDQ